MKQITAIAISGGIDSLMAACILKEQGHKVIGIHFITGYETATPYQNKSFKDRDAEKSSTEKYSVPPNFSNRAFSNIANKIGITIETIDVSLDFKKKIVDYFTKTYQAGKTPNPCLVCNPLIKFGAVLDHALKMGASGLATGHYARITKDYKGLFHLFRGVDKEKDQSYFLSFLSQSQLARACFPLGGLTKSYVQRLAKEKGLNPVFKKESQDVCFIKGKTYGEFLALQKGFEQKPGPIKDVNGKIMGEHNGLHHFTIGQRRGINCPASKPYYVIRIDRQQNKLVVGSKKDSLSSECRIVRINWINYQPASPIKVYTRIRYRHRAVESILYPDIMDSATIRFETPQEAITPGQGAVFYKDDEVLGGGWIE